LLDDRTMTKEQVRNIFNMNPGGYLWAKMYLMADDDERTYQLNTPDNLKLPKCGGNCFKCSTPEFKKYRQNNNDNGFPLIGEHIMILAENNAITDDIYYRIMRSYISGCYADDSRPPHEILDLYKFKEQDIRGFLLSDIGSSGIYLLQYNYFNTIENVIDYYHDSEYSEYSEYDSYDYEILLLDQDSSNDGMDCQEKTMLEPSINESEPEDSLERAYCEPESHHIPDDNQSPVITINNKYNIDLHANDEEIMRVLVKKIIYQLSTEIHYFIRSLPEIASLLIIHYPIDIDQSGIINILMAKIMTSTNIAHIKIFITDLMNKTLGDRIKVLYANDKLAIGSIYPIDSNQWTECYIDNIYYYYLPSKNMPEMDPILVKMYMDNHKPYKRPKNVN
jgi:hypothetical protein